MARNPNSLRRIVPKVWPLLSATPRRLAALALSYTLAGAVEALILVLLVQAASAISSEEAHVGFNLGPLGERQFTVGSLLLLVAGATLVGLAFKSLASWLAPKMSEEAMVMMRERGVDAFLDATWSAASTERHGHFQTVINNQVNKVSRLILEVSQGLGFLLTMATLLATAFAVSPISVLVIVASLSLLYFVLRPLSGLAQRWSHRASIQAKEVGAQLHHVVENVQEIRVFGVTGQVSEESAVVMRRFARSERWSRAIQLFVPAMYQAAALIFLVGALGLLYGFGGASLISLAAIILLLYRAMSYGQALQANYNQVRAALPIFDQVEESIARWEENRESFGNRHVDELETLRFTHVHFSYGTERDAVRDLDFEVERGECIGVIGPSGAGKSTLVQLLLRLRLPTAGSILVNGVPNIELANADWHRLVAYVPQEPHLIEATVEENIRFYRSGVDRAAVEEAARRAHIHNEIMEWDDGYDRAIDPREVTLSGGQKQRLCLARALAKHPTLLILDEPTSALDLRSEEAVHQTLIEMKGDVTQFIVAHRLSTLKVCDRLMVLEGGELKAFEAPNRLDESSSFFREMTALSEVR